MKEYNGLSNANKDHKDISTLFSKLYIEIESFVLPMYYSPRNDEDMKDFNFSKNPHDLIDKAML